MSATTPTRERPRRCPDCGRPYAFRVRSRIAAEITTVRHTPHHGPRGYVYFHEIEFTPSPTTDADGLLDGVSDRD